MNSLEQWIDTASKILQKDFGLDIQFSRKAALLYAYLSSYNLRPNITSGWRSLDKQKELLLRWESGDPSIRFKPAINSKHSNTGFLGKPAALAVDISTSDEKTAAKIAKLIGLKTGIDFGDPVHFYI